MTNLEVTQAFSAAVMAGDVDRLAQLVHPDFAVIEAQSLPYGGEHRGIDGFFAMFAAMQASWREIGIEHLETIGAPDGHAFAMHMRVTGRSASGEPIASEVLERWEVRDGRIAEIRPFYWDTAALAPRLAGHNG